MKAVAEATASFPRTKPGRRPKAAPKLRPLIFTGGSTRNPGVDAKPASESAAPLLARWNGHRRRRTPNRARHGARNQMKLRRTSRTAWPRFPRHSPESPRV